MSCFALAVNEEKRSRVRPRGDGSDECGAGVVPAVLHYYDLFCDATPQGIEDFFLTAGEIGSLFKEGATSLRGDGRLPGGGRRLQAIAQPAELCQVLGGSPDRVLMAAEVAMDITFPDLPATPSAAWFRFLVIQATRWERW